MKSFVKLLNSIDKKYFIFLMMAVFLWLFTFLAFATHDGLKSQMNDLGNMDQALYNTTQGQFMLSTNDIEGGRSEINRLGSHANFILLFFVPVYNSFPEPKLLLFVQVFSVTAGAYGLYLLSKKLFSKNSWKLLVGPLLYLTNPMVQDATLYDFHPIVVAMSFMIFAFYFLYTKNYKWFYFFSLLLLITKEDTPLIVAAMGIYILFIQKNKLHGLFTTIFSLAYFVLILQVVMPSFRIEASQSLIVNRYSYLGNNIFEIVKTFLTRPVLVAEKLVTFERFSYIFVLMLPVAFMSLFSLSVLLISSPSLAINLLSAKPISFYPFQFYHSSPIVVFIIISAIVAIGSKRKHYEFINTNYAAGIVLFIGLSTSLVFAPAPYSFVSSLEEFKVSPHAKKINVLKNIIPKDASLSVQNNLGAHFSQRKRITTFPLMAETLEYILIDVNDPFSRPRFNLRQRNFIFISGLYPDEYYTYVNNIFDSKGFGVYYYTPDGYILFKKKHSRDLNDKAYLMFERNYSRIKNIYDDHLENIKTFKSMQENFNFKTN